MRRKHLTPKGRALLRIGCIVMVLLAVTAIARVFQITQEDPKPAQSKNERCNEVICVKHTTPLCLPEQKSASLTLIIRSNNAEATDSRVTLTIINIASGREVTRHNAQKIPRTRTYDWTFDIAKVPHRAIVTSKSGAFAYTIDPLRQLCLAEIS